MDALLPVLLLQFVLCCQLAFPFLPPMYSGPHFPCAQRSLTPSLTPLFCLEGHAAPMQRGGYGGAADLLGQDGA
jgi:hypothetical protein